MPALLPVGLGTHGGEFDKVMLDTFQLIVLRGEKPHAALTREAPNLQKILEPDQARRAGRPIRHPPALAR